MCTQHHFQTHSNTNSVIQENFDEMKASQNEMQATITEIERNQSQIRVSTFAGTANNLVIFYSKLDLVIKQAVPNIPI